MKSRIVAIGSWLLVSVFWACGDDSSPADAGEVNANHDEHIGNGASGGSGGSGGDEDKYDIGGEVSGLKGSGLTLDLSGHEALNVNESGPFTFLTELAKGTDFRVTVATQPNHPVQVCDVTHGSGKVEQSNIDDVRIACNDVTRSIGGSLTGLVGGEITLEINGGNDLTLQANDEFTFPTAFAPGESYEVTIAAVPPGRTCSLTNNRGTTSGANVTDVKVACYAELTLHARARVKSVELTWNNNGATSYTLYRSTDKNCEFDSADSCEGAGKKLNVKSPYNWVDGLDNGTVYYFQVRGDHADNFTSKSGQPAGARPNSAELDRQVRAIAKGDDNTVYVGGDFSTVGPYTGPVAPLDKTTGLTSRMPNFPIIPGLSNPVTAVAADGSGGYFIGGLFTLVVEGGIRRNLVHVRADGTLDTSWNPDPNANVTKLALFADRLYVAGSFWQVGGIARAGLASVDAKGTGALNAEWTPSPKSYPPIAAVVADANGVYVAGTFTALNSDSVTTLAKLSTTNGELLDFPVPDGPVSALALADDVLYVAGAFANIGGAMRDHLAAISLSDGQVQTNPQLRFSESEPAPTAMAVLGDRLYLGGSFTTITQASTTEPRARLAAINRTTGALTDWKPEANATVKALAASGDTIYVAGDFTAIGTKTSRYLAGIGMDGSLHEAWSPQPGAAVVGIAVDRDSVFAFGPDVRTFGTEPRERLAAFQDGVLTAWAPSVSGGNVHALAAAGATIFVGGDFDMVGGKTRVGTAAVSDASTVRDWEAQLTRNTGEKAIVHALAIGDGRVYLGGNFSRGMGDDTRNNLIAVAFDDAVPPSAWTLSGANGDVDAIAVDGDSLFVGGAFNVVGPDATHTMLAKLNADTGAPDSEWVPSANGTVQALKVIGDHLFVGGAFTELGGAGRTHLGALAKTGAGSLHSWIPDVNGTVYGFASQGTGLYAVGDFTSYGQGFAAIDTGKDDFPRASGVLDVAANGPMYAVAADSERVYVGGNSRSVAAAVGGTSRCWFYCAQTKPTLPP